MNKSIRLPLLAIIILSFSGCQKTENSIVEEPDLADSATTEKTIQHLKLEDISSEAEATTVMQTQTEALKSKKQLDALELHEIHMITYSLEKAAAYFVANRSGKAQTVAKEMAEVIERIHLGSENNRLKETKQALDEYYQLYKTFSEYNVVR